MRECARWGRQSGAGFATPPSASPPAGSTAPFTAPIVDGDAVLFFYPPETRGVWLPDYLLDVDYRREMSRRSQIGGPPFVRFPVGYTFRRADYMDDLDAPGFTELMDTIFAAQDANRDGVITADEYVDPIPR